MKVTVVRDKMWWWCITTTIILLLRSPEVYPQDDISDLDKPIPVIDVVGVAGDKVHLPCEVQPNDPHDAISMVLWFKEDGGEPIYSFDVRERNFHDPALWSSPAALGPRAFFVTASSPAHLSIDRLDVKDEGVYRCRVDFKNSPTRNQKMNLTVIVTPERPIILDGTTKDISRIEEPYNEGDDVNLICETRGGKPPPKLTWFLENTVIDESYHYKSDAGVTVNHLSYPKVGRQHLRARLICQASNTNLVQPQSKVLILNVNLKPLVVQILTKEPRLSADKKYEVECRSTGSRPMAVITWWIANRQIKKAKNYSAENNQSLSILSFVPTIEDDGKYLTCRAENPVISDSLKEDKWRLDVQYQPVVTLRMGSTLNPDDIKEGDDVYFECRVRANPKEYKLSWFKDGKEMKNNATAGIVLSDYSLVLQGLTRSSAGEYTCLAANSEGKTASNSVPLQIMFAPVCKEGKAEVVVGALKQETVSLVCAVESRPPPMIFHWTFNNSGELVEVAQPKQQQHPNVQPPGTPSIAESLRERFHGPRLNYTPATEMDYGTVACWASNQVGRQLTPCVFQVIAAGRPYPLHNCTATELSTAIEELGSKSGSGLMVKCIDGYDGGLPIKSYQLEIVGEEDDSWILLNKTVTDGANGPVFDVTSLTAGRSYRLFLYAINAKGRSDPTILEPVTLKGVAMYTTGNADASILSPVLLGLAATATLLALAVAGVLAALYRKHTNGRGGQSPKHAPIAREPTHAGVTTPIHPQIKQTTDDMDPDIIPNEYERRPLTYTPIYKTPPQRRRKDLRLGEMLPEEKPIVQQKLDLQPDPRLSELDSSYSQNHAIHQNTYIHHPPTMADFKQMAMDAYNQRNNQNVYYSLQRANKGVSTMPQRPVSSSISAHAKFHQPEVVTRSNRIQESCI